MSYINHVELLRHSLIHTSVVCHKSEAIKTALLVLVFLDMLADFFQVTIFNTAILSDGRDLRVRRLAYRKDLCTTVIHKHLI